MGLVMSLLFVRCAGSCREEAAQDRGHRGGRELPRLRHQRGGDTREGAFLKSRSVEGADGILQVRGPYIRDL